MTQLTQPRPNVEQIFAGDLLDVGITTGLERQGPNRTLLRVAEDGTVLVPLVGAVPVAGMMIPQAEFAVHEASVSRGIYRNPQVSVRVAERRSIVVNVQGEVSKPGQYNLPVMQADLLAAISMAGGLSESAGEVIEISYPPNPYAVQQASYPGRPPLRSGGRNMTVNLGELTKGAPGDYHLENGSVVMVSKRPPRTFSVIGLVKKPGQLSGLNDQDIRLLDAVAMAGGRTFEFADKVIITRTIEGRNEPVTIAASIKDAKSGGPANVLLAPGDIVSVEETPLTFTWGTLRNFTRMSFGAAVPLF